MKKTILNMLFIGLAGILHSQAIIEPVNAFIEKYPDINKYFIYQSTLRLLNQNHDPDFDKLIKPLKKVNAFVSHEKSGVTKDGFKQLLAELAEEDFELLVSYKEKNAIIQLMGKTQRSESQYIFAVYGPDEFAIIEMDGSLDLQYLKALENLDFSKAEELLLNQNRS